MPALCGWREAPRRPSKNRLMLDSYAIEVQDQA